MQLGAQSIVVINIADTKGKPMANELFSIGGRIYDADRNGNIILNLMTGKHRVCPLEQDSQYASTCKTIQVQENGADTQQFKLVFLTEGLISSVTVKGTGVQGINKRTLSFMPTTGQSNDFIKLMAGVFSTSELTSQFNVRGGNYDENIIYVNGIEIFRPQLVRTGQQEGLGFVNSDLIENIEFFPGGFEAKYGDKLSSVLDVKYLEPEDTISGTVTASFLGLNFSLNQRVNKKFSYVFGARYRANNYLFNTLDAQGDYNPIFYDVQGLFSYRFNYKWRLDYLGNFAQNKFSFEPVLQTTRFGTINRPLELTINFAGLEVMNYITGTNALSLTFNPSVVTSYKFTQSLFNSLENEYYTVEGAYNLGELDNNLGSDNFGQRKQTLGLGYFINHARNDLQSWVSNSSISGMHRNRANKSLIEWAVNYRQENFDDQVLEWKYSDSAELNLAPRQNSDDSLNLDSYLKTSAILQNHQFSAFVQRKSQVIKALNGFINIGIRATHRSLGNQTFISPRVRFSIDPYFSKNKTLPDSLQKSLVLNFNAGYYYQPAFYREMRDLRGNLNTNLKPQKSIHFTAGATYMLKIWNRPFKYDGELYYKHYDNLIPYAIDNVRIRYFSQNNGRGYAAGFDNRLYGEFIKGMESWFNLAILTTREKFTFTENGVTKETDWLRRPTDARVVSSIFFQDELPKNPNYRMSLSLNFVSGLPYYFIEANRFAPTSNRISGYQRVDVGFQKIIVGPKIKNRKPWMKNIESAFISLDVFNLLDNNNVVAFNIVKDYANNFYGVPNYLTGRRLNLRLHLSF